ncbi:unnamed protein product [Musa acuminata subsp. burmannicoides]
MATRHLLPLPLLPIPLVYKTLLRFPSKQLAPHPRTLCSSAASSSSYSSMASTPKKVLVPIANGTEPMEAVITIDVLRRAGADVTVASAEKDLRVDACWGVKLVADALVADVATASFDLISLPGGIPGSDTLRDCGVLESIVKKQAEKGGLYAAICAAPAVALGSWGLLKGLKATCYPSFMDKLPSDATAVESRVQVEGQVVTSRGPGTAMEYSLALVEKLYGKDKADEVAGPMVMRPHHGVEFAMNEINSTTWKFDSTPQILVPIANGSEEMEAVMIIDTLRRAKANVVVASVEDKLEIVASRKVKLIADMLLDEAIKLQYDLIVLPGGLPGAQAFSNSEKLVNLLRKQAESSKLYGAICASPAIVLETHGLLKGKKATAYPAMCDKLSDQSCCENRVVVDGNLITSRGPGTSLEFALAIVEKLFGRQKSLDLAKRLSWDNVCQTFEKAYKSNDLVQIPRKYVDVVGKQFRDIIDEVVGDWLDPAGDCAEGLDTKNSLDGDIASKIDGVLKEELDVSFSDDNVSICVKWEPNSSSVGNSSLIAASDLNQDSSYNNEFDECQEETLPTKAANCSDVIDGNPENFLPSVASLSGLPKICPLVDESLKLEPCESRSVEDRPPTETCDAARGIHTSQEFISPRGCLVNEHELQIKQDNSRASLRETEVCLSGDDKFNGDDVIDAKAEPMEVSQDLDINDNWEDNEDYELAMISYQKSRASYKKKLGASLITKLRQFKGHKVKNSCCDIVGRERDRQGNELLKNPNLSSVHDSLESDWELL